MRDTSLMAVQDFSYEGVPRHRKTEQRQGRFIQQYGITIMAVALLIFWTWAVSTLSAKNARKETEARLSAQYAAEYEAKLQAYIDQQEAVRRALGDESVQAQIEREADALARLIGPMKTKRMKLTMLWNALVRVDSPFYDNTVEEVIAQPGQWIFYKESNPIRDKDRELALEQVKFWHEGRYPADLTEEFVIGEWSEDDYVLRNKWEKDSSTVYWRYPE